MWRGVTGIAYNACGRKDLTLIELEQIQIKKQKTAYMLENCNGIMFTK